MAAELHVPIKPHSKYVVATKRKGQKQTSSGLYIPPAADNNDNIAIVLAVGEKVNKVAAGDTILLKDSFDTTKISIQSIEYIVINSKNIIATVEE